MERRGCIESSTFIFQNCHVSLITLAEVVKKLWKNKYMIYVLEGYIIPGVSTSFKHGKHSLHYAGRAFDVTLINTLETERHGTKYTRLGDVVPKHTLKSLGVMAFRYAKFTFVELKRNHLHLSCDTICKLYFSFLSCDWD